METCKSPRKVFNAAYALATACLKEHTSKFSRKDFTGPQLFACLVLREHQKKSFRGVVALLKDCPEWCADIGLKKVPNHNTLCRAHRTLVKPRVIEDMLDVSVQTARQLQRAAKKKAAGKSSAARPGRSAASRHLIRPCSSRTM